MKRVPHLFLPECMTTTVELPEPTHCTCGDVGGGWTLEISEGSIYLTHKVCGKQLLHDTLESVSMEEITVDMTVQRGICHCDYRCDCDVFLLLEPKGGPVVIQLTPEQREALAILNEADAGIYESGSLEDRLTIGHRRTLDLCHRYATPYLRTLVVAPVANLEAWRREFRKREDHPSVFGSPKASPEVWETFFPNRQPGSWIISWESMRGFIAANQRTHPRKTSKKDVTRAMDQGTVPPWTGTGTWDLVIADDSQHMAFRNTLQRQVMQTIQSRHRLALSDNATGPHPEGLWGTLNWLWPDRYPNYWNWLNTCFNVDYIKNAKFTKTEILGEKMPGSSWLDVPCAVRKAP